MHKLYKLPVILLVLILASCNKTAIKQNSKFYNSWETEYSAALLPVDASIVMKQMDGDNQRQEQDEAWARTFIQEEVIKRLRDKKYEVNEFDFSVHMKEDKELSPALERLRMAHKEYFSTTGAQLLPKEEAFNINDTVGTDVNLFTDLVDIDIWVLVQYSGFKKSSGMTSRDFTLQILSSAASAGLYSHNTNDSGGVIKISLIDSVSGEILWSSAGASYDTNFSSFRSEENRIKSHVKTAVGNALALLPNKTLTKENSAKERIKERNENMNLNSKR